MSFQQTHPEIQEIVPASQLSRRALMGQAVGQLVGSYRRNEEIWRFLSVQDIRSRFRRSRFGVLWSLMQQLVFVLGASMVWAAIFGTPPADFIPFIAVGFAMWAVMSASVVDACNVFMNSAGYIRQSALPLQIYIWRHVATTMFFAGINIATAAVVTFVLKGIPSPVMLLALVVGLGLVSVLLVLATAVFAYVGTIFRDLPHALSALFQMLFVVTPVIFPPDILISRGFGLFVDLNPLASVLQLVREPLVFGRLPLLHDYAYVLFGIAVFAVCYVLLHARYGRHIVFYL